MKLFIKSPVAMARMSLKRYLMVTCFLFIIQQGYSQTYTLPDTNMRNRLLAFYPFLMTGNQLNIPAANAYTGALNLNNAKIQDASGIEYFPNLFSVDLSGNKLSSLPSFANLTGIRKIYCSHNNLTSLPDISFLTNLEVLVISSNNFQTLPDFSGLNLKELHINQTGIDTIKGLPNLTDLEQLHCWGNNIRDLSGLNSNTKLILLYAHENQLTQLPVLSNKPGFTSVVLNKNKFTFEDLLPIGTHPAFNITTTYAPQQLFGKETTLLARKNDPVQLKANIDPLLTSNWYKWYKNGVLLDSNQTGVWDFNSIDFSDAGTYYVKVSNAGLPALTLKSHNWVITVLDCEGCSAVFSPDGDGVIDSYKIEEPGVARVYSLKGALVKEFPIPGEWDGTDSGGSPADAGYYAIVINDKKVINVSLIR